MKNSFTDRIFSLSLIIIQSHFQIDIVNKWQSNYGSTDLTSFFMIAFRMWYKCLSTWNWNDRNLDFRTISTFRTYLKNIIFHISRTRTHYDEIFLYFHLNKISIWMRSNGRQKNTKNNSYVESERNVKWVELLLRLIRAAPSQWANVKSLLGIDITSLFDLLCSSWRYVFIFGVLEKL